MFVATEMYGCVDFVVLLATVVKTDINRIVVPCYVANDIIHSAITNVLNGRGGGEVCVCLIEAGVPKSNAAGVLN